MKRGTDHIWQIRNYKCDVALYAHCKCGFEYSCSHSIRNEDGTWSFKQEITYMYRYCPHCGARKKWMTDTVKIGRTRYEQEKE